jgi:uncharacterized iron-regulated membrane protein
VTLQQEAPPARVDAVPSRATRGPNRTWRFLQVTHRWFSLITGTVLLLIILSGAILVLAPEIDEWTQPELYRSTPSERTLTPEQAVASLKRAEPDFVPGDVVRQRGIYEIYDLEYVKSAYVDPGTGRVNGIADRQSGVMGFLRNLHLCALSCEGYPAYIPFLAEPAPVLGNEELTVGGLILAVTGLILIFLCISGLVIWWRGLRRWRRGFQLRRGKGTYKLNYDLHNVVGIAVLPLLLMWAVTGAGFELKQIRDAWYAVLPGEKPPEFEDPVSKPGDGRIGIDEAERIGVAQVPGSRAVSVSVPDQSAEDSAYYVYVAHGSDPYDHGTWPGNVGIAVDRYSGDAEVTYDNREGGIARVWEDWQYPFHAGYFMGWGYRMSWFIFGFLPLVLAVTAVTTWWMRRRKRKRKRSRLEPVAQ